MLCIAAASGICFYSIVGLMCRKCVAMHVSCVILKFTRRLSPVVRSGQLPDERRPSLSPCLAVPRSIPLWRCRLNQRHWIMLFSLFDNGSICTVLVFFGVYTYAKIFMATFRELYKQALWRQYMYVSAFTYVYKCTYGACKNRLIHEFVIKH